MKVIRSFLSVLFLLLAPAAVAADLIGQTSVIDGDTLEIHGIRIRLWGIDAPESARIRADGSPSTCSDDANGHP